jgi:hypothetical protein
MGDVRAHVGWEGQFTTDQAEGAYPNGTRIRKVNAEANDSHRNGATGTVLGSLRGGPILGYFIEWDNMPRMAVFVAAGRVRRANINAETKAHYWPPSTPLRGRA